MWLWKNSLVACPIAILRPTKISNLQNTKGLIRKWAADAKVFYCHEWPFFGGGVFLKTNALIFTCTLWQPKMSEAKKKNVFLIPAELRALSWACHRCLMGQRIIWILGDRKHWDKIAVMPGSMVISFQKPHRIIREKGGRVLNGPCETEKRDTVTNTRMTAFEWKLIGPMCKIWQR